MIIDLNYIRTRLNRNNIDFEMIYDEFKRVIIDLNLSTETIGTDAQHQIKRSKQEYDN